MSQTKKSRTHEKRPVAKKPAARSAPKIPKAALPYYETLGQAAVAMGVDRSILSLARQHNAPGFQGPRVYPTKLLPWLKKHLVELEAEGNEKEALQCRKLVGQCERIEFNNRIAMGLYILKADVDAWLTEKGEALKRIVQTKVVHELLPKLSGLSVPEMIPLAGAATLAILNEFRKPLPTPEPQMQTCFRAVPV